MGALTSTDGAHPRERPSGGVGAGRGWNRVLDRATPVASALRSLHAVSHSLRPRTPAHLRNVAVRPVRRRRNGRRASPLPGDDATAVVKLRHHPRPTESGPAFRLGLTDGRFRGIASALEVLGCWREPAVSCSSLGPGKGALTSTDEAHPHVRPSLRVGAGGGRSRTMDGEPLGRHVEPPLRPHLDVRSRPSVRAMAMRSVRCWCGGSYAAALLDRRPLECPSHGLGASGIRDCPVDRATLGSEMPSCRLRSVSSPRDA
jgi:hypothetical protein